MKKLLAISDSPKVTTGFGNVAAQLYNGMNQAFEFDALGILDFEWDLKGELDYPFIPVKPTDPLGLAESVDTILRRKPDIVWYMTAPGDSIKYYVVFDEVRRKHNLNFKTVAYVPIEGFPSSILVEEGFNTMLQNGDHIVTWSKSSQKIIKQEMNIDVPFIYFGADHAPFKPYSAEMKAQIRKALKLEDKFVCISVGVNKRAKGFDKLIYTAAELKKRGVKDIIFYCHTNPENPTMQGYRLKRLAARYNVLDYFIWKPEININALNEWTGIRRGGDGVLPELLDDSFQSRLEYLSQLSFIDRLNMADIYVDASQVEGWGLPVGEAMACGIPVLMVNDYHVRSEVFGPGAYMYPPTPVDQWDTWHTGARLVGIDPVVLADHIIKLKEAPEYRATLAKLGYDHIQQFTWDKARKEMVDYLDGIK